MVWDEANSSGRFVAVVNKNSLLKHRCLMLSVLAKYSYV